MSLTDAIESWARSTLAIGAGCATFGALRAALSGAPLGLLGYAAGSNGIVVGGGYLALRSAFRAALPSSIDDRAVAAAAGAVTGAAAYGAMGGARRAPVGAAVLALLAVGGEGAAAGFSAWRSAEAAAILAARGASGGGGGGGGVGGAPAAVATPPPAPPRRAAPPGDAPLPQGHSPQVREGFLSFLPVSLSPRSSDLRQLEKRLWRLRELDELLGFAEVEVDPRAAALRERERVALAALQRRGGAAGERS